MINSRTLATWGQYLFLSVMAFLSIFPFFWMMISATNTSVEIMGGKVSLGSALSTNVTNFFTLVDVPLVFWNSAKVAVLATVLTIVVSSFAGYGFEMFKSK
jgi:lactose/L-arabinose transport system permease protein